MPKFSISNMLFGRNSNGLTHDYQQFLKKYPAYEATQLLDELRVLQAKLRRVQVRRPHGERLRRGLSCLLRLEGQRVHLLDQVKLLFV